MITITNSIALNEYKQTPDEGTDIKHFRLYYKSEPTSLVWYDGKMIFVSKDFYILKDGINLNLKPSGKCSLFASDLEMIRELEHKKIPFVLEGNLKELYTRVGKFATSILSNDVSIELIDDFDYSTLNEPVYMGDGTWLCLDE